MISMIWWYDVPHSLPHYLSISRKSEDWNWIGIEWDSAPQWCRLDVQGDPLVRVKQFDTFSMADCLHLKWLHSALYWYSKKRRRKKCNIISFLSHQVPEKKVELNWMNLPLEGRVKPFSQTCCCVTFDSIQSQNLGSIRFNFISISIALRMVGVRRGCELNRKLFFFLSLHYLD